MFASVSGVWLVMWWVVITCGVSLVGNQTVHAANGVLSNSGYASGTILSPGQKDTYIFTANAGNTVLLRVARINGNLWPALRLYGPTGAIVTGTTGDGTISTLSRNILIGGTYTVEISNSGTTHRTGEYRLYSVVGGRPVEHGALVNGGSRSHVIDRGDLDSYTFTATKGESIMLRAARLSGDVWPSLRLYGPNGGLFYTTNGTGLTSTVVRNILTSGTYSVVVSDGAAKHTHTGAYRLYYVRGVGAKEHGTLVNGGAHLQAIDRGDLDSYTFNARAGESVVLNASRISGEVTPTLRLFGPTGLLLDFAGGSEATANMGRNILQSGTYVVVVSDGGPEHSHTGDYTVSFSTNAKRFSYAALGDGYSSGEGLAPYLNPEDWYFPLPLPFDLEEKLGINTGRHRSDRSYPYQISLPGNSVLLALRPDVEFSFFACTGAGTVNVRAGGENLHGEPPQLSTVNAINANRDLVTVSIGGNDTQWVGVVLFCFIHNACDAIKPFAPYNDMTLAQLVSPLLLAYSQAEIQDVHRQIKSAAPNAAVVVFGYPVIMSGNECLALQVPGLPEVKLSAGEQAFLRSANIELNNVIARSAAQTGLHFIPVASHFADHEICDAQENWVNGFVTFNPAASFHPTARGQAEYARLFDQYFSGAATAWPHGYLLNGLPRNPPPSGTLGVPPTGAVGAQAALPRFGALPVKPQVISPNSAGVQGLVVPRVGARLRGSGYRVNEAVTLSLVINGTRIPLGHAVANANGELDANVAIPPMLQPDTLGQCRGPGVRGKWCRVVADVGSARGGGRDYRYGWGWRARCVIRACGGVWCKLHAIV